MTRKTWTLQEVWNKSLESEQWPTKPRDYIRGSEIGSAFIDRYYKMMGEQPTNPFDSRLLRKFQAGNIFEWIVGLVLRRAGLFESTQDEVRVKGPDHLDVVGHLDFVMGGKPDVERVVQDIGNLELPGGLNKAALAVIKWLNETYPNGMQRMVSDVKSVNSMLFWSQVKHGLDKAYPHHQLQLYTYMKGMGQKDPELLKEGRILYLSKDDLTLVEVSVVPDAEMEHKWHKDVQTISHHYNNKLVPQREPDVSWSPTKKKYEINWMIQRSSYRDKITGLNKDKWETEIKKLVGRLNYRVKKLEHKGDQVIQKELEPYLEQELMIIYGDPNKVFIRKQIIIKETS